MDTLKSEHVVGIPAYLAVFTLLLVGTALTTWVAYIDLGPLNVIIMLAIAFTKATVVVLFFMHLKFASRLTWLWACGSVFWLLVLFLITLSDYLTRGSLS